jgi:glycosyltransferase involved in cell wall biosynthesis
MLFKVRLGLATGALAGIWWAVMARAFQAARPTLLWHSPLPPDPGGLALYSASLLEHLRSSHDIVLVTPHARTALSEPLQSLKVVTPDEAALWPPDSALPVYHMGNNVEQCAWIFQALRQRPGLVVVHDLNIHGFLLDCYGRGVARPGWFARWREPSWPRRHPYWQMLHEAHGDAGARAAEAFLRDGAEPDIAALPCHRLLTRSAAAVVAHSRMAVSQLESNGDQVPVVHLPLGIEHPIPEPPGGAARFRAGLGLTASDFLIVCGGFFEPSRRIDKVIEALALLRESGRQPHLALAGAMEPAHRDWLAGLAARRGVATQVHFLGFLSDDAEFVSGLHAADIIVHLRHPTHGETSATVHRALSVGRPVIVSDVDAYRELPDDCCWKLETGPDEAVLLAAYIDQLILRPNVRQVMGEWGRCYIAQTHAWPHIAKAFAQISTWIGTRTVHELG